MKLFDSHAHLNFPDYGQDYREVWERAKRAGLIGLINVGTDLATSKRAIEIAHELDLAASVGIHPNDAKQYAGSDWKRTMEEMVNDDKVVAIGETGFDFYAPERQYRQFSTVDEQTALLEYFLDLVERVEKPMIIHCREAYDRLIEVLATRSVRGVVHAFGGDERVARRLLDLRLNLSFTAQVTYPKNQDFYADLLPTIPLDRILLETDCPFLPPEGLRGQRNEPVHVDVIAQTIGKMIGQSAARVAEATTKNALDLFNIFEK